MERPSKGIWTTEFWMIAPVVIGSIYASIQGMIPQPWGLLISSAAGSLYAALRTWLKVAHAQNMVTNIPDLPDPAPLIFPNKPAAPAAGGAR